jgi:hypothetical protein
VKLKIHPPISELLRALPEGTLTAFDLMCLRDIKAAITTLRCTPGINASLPTLFTTDVRAALAVELTAALAQIIAQQVPRTATGRPSKLPALREEWAAKREAAAAKAQALLVEQLFKRRLLDLRETLDVFTERVTKAAARETVGSPVDGEARRIALYQAIDPVAAALAALREAETASQALREGVLALDPHLDALRASCTRWCNVKGLSTGRAAGVHKGEALPAFVAACTALSRDVAEHIRTVKIV